MEDLVVLMTHGALRGKSFIFYVYLDSLQGDGDGEGDFENEYVSYHKNA